MKCLINNASDTFREKDRIVEINTMEELKKFMISEMSDVVVRLPYYEDTKADIVITVYDDYIE